MPATPEDVSCHLEHMWVRREGTSSRIGITDLAQDALGVVVYVDLPDVGSRLESGRPCGEIESTKTVSDLVAPVTGQVVGSNDAVQGDPEVVNRDPYGDGWLLLVELDGGPGDLLSAQEYAATASPS